MKLKLASLALEGLCLITILISVLGFIVLEVACVIPENNYLKIIAMNYFEARIILYETIIILVCY